MDCYVLHVQTSNHIFAPFDLDDVCKVFRDSDEELDPDDEQMTHTQEVTAFTHEDDKFFDDTEKIHYNRHALCKKRVMFLANHPGMSLQIPSQHVNFTTYYTWNSTSIVNKRSYSILYSSSCKFVENVFCPNNLLY